MQIKFGDCQLRSWRDYDQEALVKYGNNRKIWLNLQDIFPSPYTREDARAWIQRARTQPETYFAIASGTEAIGSIGFNLHPDILRRSADIGYWLGEPFWGKGIATSAVRALVRYAFASWKAGWQKVSPKMVRLLIL
jgi:ribosomal-protein-alanine N-acetyltransferase